jgi:uncharacterized protein YjbI with pentapeptide repeats
MVRRNNAPQRPRLPRDLPLPSEIVPTDDLELFQLTVQGDYSDQRCQGMSLEEAHIFHASFVGADLRNIRFVDVLIEGADFSGADMEEASFSRVEFTDCRMSGVLIPQAKLQDVTFTECKLDGANFRMSEADRILFDHVNLTCTEFSAGRFTSACFFDCDLSEAEFSHAVVPGARFHGSSLADIKGGEYLRDIVIDSSQVLPLALRVFIALGIRVDDERDIAGS